MTKRTIAAGVVAAAALVAGGWAGAGYAIDEDPGSTSNVDLRAETPLGLTSIWPSTMDAASPPWEVYGFTMGTQSGEGPAVEVAHDPLTGRTVVQTNGDTPVRYEIDGMRVYDRVEGGEWNETSVDGAGTRRRMAALAEPTHVRDLFPEAAEPFVTVEEQGRTDDGHLSFVVTFDADAYGRVAPLDRIQWTHRHFTVEQPDYVWTLDVRDDGYIVRWVDSVPGAVLTWNESEPAIEFESPLR